MDVWIFKSFKVNTWNSYWNNKRDPPEKRLVFSSNMASIRSLFSVFSPVQCTSSSATDAQQGGFLQLPRTRCLFKSITWVQYKICKCVWNWCLGTREAWVLRSWERLGMWIWGMDKTSCFQQELRGCVEWWAFEAWEEKNQTTKQCTSCVPCGRTMWWIFLGRAVCLYQNYVLIYEQWSNKATFVDNMLKIKREISLLLKWKGSSIRSLSSLLTEQWLPRQLDPGDRREMYFVAHRLGGEPKLAINNQAH